MATNSMTPSLYQAPTGLESIAMEPAVEIEIENPEGVKIGIDGMEIDLMPEKEEGEFDANLAEDMDEATLSEIASDLDELVTADINSRKEWADTFVKGLEVLGLRYEQRTEPWDGAFIEPTAYLWLKTQARAPRRAPGGRRGRELHPRPTGSARRRRGRPAGRSARPARPQSR